jgi:hypothetical protein
MQLSPREGQEGSRHNREYAQKVFVKGLIMARLKLNKKRPPTSRTYLKGTDLDPNALRAECIVNMIWDWHNYTDHCFDALRWGSLDDLQQGQPDNSHARDLYGDAFVYFGVDPFFDILAASSSTAPYVKMFDELDPNLTFQYNNNLKSLTDAMYWWFHSSSHADQNAHQALFELLYGQRQSMGVMDLYRACFREDRNRLFLLVRKKLGNMARSHR